MVLSTAKMQKVRLLFYYQDRDNVIKFLHEKGVIDVRQSSVALERDLPPDRLAVLSDLLAKVNGAIALLPARKGKRAIKKTRRLPVDRLIKRVGSLRYIDAIFEADERLRDLDEERKALDHVISIATMFENTGIDFSHLKSNTLSFSAFTAGRREADAISRSLEGRENIEVIKREVGKNLFLFFIAHKKSEDIDEVLAGHSINELDLAAKGLSGTPHDAISEAKRKMKMDEGMSAELRKKLASIAEGKRDEILGFKEMLEIEVERASLSSEFKKTDKTFVMEGWVPAKDYENFSIEITKFTSGRCYLEKIQDDELAPTLYTRPKFFRSFDYLMDFFSTPRSDEIDPTWIFIISFPIFYGLMVSDVGYGIVSFLLATWFTTFTDPEGLVYNTSKVWQIAAFSAIFFGIISNQYFGLQLGGIFKSMQLFDWMRDINTVLVVTLLFGVAQVVLGLVLGFVNKLKRRETRLAFGRLFSIGVVFAGAVAVSGFLFNSFDPTTTLYSGIAALAMLVIAAVLSGIEATELTNLITHPLSYTRIMGFGLASIIIAFLIDSAFTPTLAYGILPFIGLLLAFIALHLFNMLLAIFEGIVQGARLNFVEFFSKFYEGGGVKFKPFAFKKKYIE
ncbi:MAG: hypothetical protein LVQ95_03200 [Candidatus Micrarchaeales archaeon]|nr:hypothetical protein [Candidatus Micrarchaeales archaeon]